MISCLLTYYLAILTGDVKMSAEKRLMVHSHDNDDPEGEIESIEIIKEKMKNIIDIAVAGEGLQKLREKMENIALFQTFVSFCLIHFTTSLNWRYKACSVVISDIFTVSDEALCILLLENNAADYAMMLKEKRIINRKEARPKYTKVLFSDKKFKGWDRRGIRRFDVIVNAVKESRKLTTSKNMELEFKSRYAKLLGNDIEQNNSDSDSDYDDLDELNGYDGFAGDVELDRSRNNDENNTNELEGVTNRTEV